MKKLNRFLFKNKLINPLKVFLSILITMIFVVYLEYYTEFSVFYKFALFLTLLKYYK